MQLLLLNGASTLSWGTPKFKYLQNSLVRMDGLDTTLDPDAHPPSLLQDVITEG